MQYEVEINGRIRQVAVSRAGGGFTIAIDGRTFHVDAARVDAHTLSLMVEDGVRLKADPTDKTVGSGTDKTVGSGTDKTVGSGTDKTVGSGFSRTRAYEVTVAADVATSQLAVRVGSTPLLVGLNGQRRHGKRDDSSHTRTGPQRVVAPMPGKIVRVLVHSGQAVAARQPLVVVEAMKMENELRAGRDGTVAEIHAQEGQSVDAGALLVIIQ